MCDWQTRVTCSVQEGAARLKLVQLVPTAGCDPDEAAKERQWEHSLGGGGQLGPGQFADGGACAVPGSLAEGRGSQPALEAVLPLAKPGQRCRAVVYLASSGQLDRVELHLERKYAEFAPGRPAPELEAQQTTLSGRPRLDPTQLAGSWKAAQGEAPELRWVA